VVVWDVATKEISVVVHGFHTMGIGHVAWSPCGMMLASIGGDGGHTLAVHTV
ncbi:unnamed protein product, partial [Discosporangium mesarthrocarpum]